MYPGSREDSTTNANQRDVFAANSRWIIWNFLRYLVSCFLTIRDSWDAPPTLERHFRWTEADTFLRGFFGCWLLLIDSHCSLTAISIFGTRVSLALQGFYIIEAPEFFKNVSVHLFKSLHSAFHISNVSGFRKIHQFSKLSRPEKNYY